MRGSLMSYMIEVGWLRLEFPLSVEMMALGCAVRRGQVRSSLQKDAGDVMCCADVGSALQIS